jgi:putative CocE/NonD family hydrolase
VIHDPTWIPLSDGCRLAARVWLPEDALERPAPVILEAVPYRRRDGTLTGDQGRYAWWAERGFAGVRVDLRGSGDSEGLLLDEYLAQEQDDDVEVIDWLARQPWCNGSVGMIGYSWGGFAGLQVAARRPAALRAVVTVNSTVRRYTDDCHYTGGRVNAHDMLSWATTMLAFDARPPDPAIVGEGWREQWLERLDVAPPMIDRWLSHPLEDDYWKHGSVAFDYDAIDCAVLAVGGWSDPYRNAVLDLVEHLRGPRFGLIGPWAHGYPHETDPGPQIDFLGECERFFGRYLRDDPNGYDDVPSLRAYVQEHDPPSPLQLRRRGRWVAVDRWPRSETATFGLLDVGLAAGALGAGERSIA